MNKKILILSGDPNSINSEIIYKSWKKISSALKKKIYFISNYNLLKKQFSRLKYKIELEKVNNLNSTNSKKIKILNIKLKFNHPFKVHKNQSKKFLEESIDYAHKLALSSQVTGIITCPINKKLLNQSKIGLTEYLAKKCNVKKFSEVMLITNEIFSVCPVTTHIDLKEVSKKISKHIIIQKIKTIDKWFRKYKRKKPKVCVLGLNPHNAELRRGSEEKKVIIPAISNLKKDGVKIIGPVSADTIFMNQYKKYDVVVGMYHDQVLSPFKTIFKLDAINVTLGLKYLRVSPDHGIASDLIMKKKANAKSLIKCINFLKRFTK